MSAAENALQAMIASMERLGSLVDDAMSDVTQAVLAEQRRTMAQGMSAYAEPWKLTQEGKRPLQHADKALKVMSVNRTVYITLLGPEARHHLGHARGKIKRGIIPERGLPSAMADSIRNVLQQHFDDAVQQQ